MAAEPVPVRRPVGGVTGIDGPEDVAGISAGIGRTNIGSKLARDSY